MHLIKTDCRGHDLIALDSSVQMKVSVLKTMLKVPKEADVVHMVEHHVIRISPRMNQCYLHVNNLANLIPMKTVDLSITTMWVSRSRNTPFLLHASWSLWHGKRLLRQEKGLSVAYQRASRHIKRKHPARCLTPRNYTEGRSFCQLQRQHLRQVYANGLRGAPEAEPRRELAIP